MPVDPKYSGLPGIAWDQPDLFETVQGEYSSFPKLSHNKRVFIPGGGDDDSTENTDTESEDQEKLHLSSLSWIGDMEVGVEKVCSFNICIRLRHKVFFRMRRRL